MIVPEFLDVVDPLGMPLGIKKSRSEVHAAGDWHRTVHIWVLNPRGELLFQKRSLSRESFPGTWDVSSAGHVSFGESPVESAKKEVFEELGVRVEENDLVHLWTVTTSSIQHGGTFIDNEISDVFLVRKDLSPDSLVLQPSEVDDVCYFPYSELGRIALSPNPAFAPHPEEYSLLHRFLLENRRPEEH